MILCLCLSPALDITYRVARLVPGGTNRVHEVAHRPGGKAVNVARVLHALGDDARVLAPCGGDVGARFAADLAALGIAADLVPDNRPMRRTVAVVDDATREATVLVEPAEISSWTELAEVAAQRIPGADVVVISGSVPTDGVPADAVSTLVGLARRAGRPVVVDTSGSALQDALSARPTVVKPNAEELTHVAGGDVRDPIDAARAIARDHDTIVVASLGADGVIAVDGDHTWRARPAATLDGNPTGAGDALVAGLARGLLRGRTIPELLPDAVALSAAAVLSPLAGDVDQRHHADQLTGVVVEQVTGQKLTGQTAR